MAGLDDRTSDRRSGEITNRDGSAAGRCVATVIRSTENAGVNYRAASAGSSTYYCDIYILVTGIRCRSTAPGRNCRAVDGLVGRTSDRRSRDITNGDGSAAGRCVTAIIRSTEDTGMNYRTASAGSGANHSYIYVGITGIAGSCNTPGRNCRAVDGLVGRTSDRRSGDITNGDGSAAGRCVATIIRSTEDTGMNHRAASAGSGAHYSYIHICIAGIAGRCITPGRNCRTIDGLVGRTSNGRSRDVSYSNRGTAGGCVATVIRSTENTGMYYRAASAWSGTDYSYIYRLIAGITGRCITPDYCGRTVDGLVGRTRDRRSGDITNGN